MPRIELAPEVRDDFDRIFDHLFNHGVDDDAPARIHDIVSAIDVLARSPLIGGPTCVGKRELVIGRGASGSVALYRYVAALDAVFVLAIRGQREAGFTRD